MIRRVEVKWGPKLNCAVKIRFLSSLPSSLLPPPLLPPTPRCIILSDTYLNLIKRKVRANPRNVASYVSIALNAAGAAGDFRD